MKRCLDADIPENFVSAKRQKDAPAPTKSAPLQVADLIPPMPFDSISVLVDKQQTAINYMYYALTHDCMNDLESHKYMLDIAAQCTTQIVYEYEQLHKKKLLEIEQLKCLNASYASSIKKISMEAHSLQQMISGDAVNRSNPPAYDQSMYFANTNG